MAGESIDLEDLLNQQEQQPDVVQATIERIDSDPDRVRITPFVPGVGCLCSVAVTVPKTAIRSLTTTDETHRCCGKVVTVVEVEFGDETTRDVFSQLPGIAAPTPYTNVASAGVGPVHNQATLLGRGQVRCAELFERCLGEYPDPLTECICGNMYRRCMSPTAPLMAC